MAYQDDPNWREKNTLVQIRQEYAMHLRDLVSGEDEPRGLLLGGTVGLDKTQFTLSILREHNAQEYAKWQLDPRGSHRTKRDEDEVEILNSKDQMVYTPTFKHITGSISEPELYVAAYYVRHLGDVLYLDDPATLRRADIQSFLRQMTDDEGLCRYAFKEPLSDPDVPTPEFETAGKLVVTDNILTDAARYDFISPALMSRCVRLYLPTNRHQTHEYLRNTAFHDCLVPRFDRMKQPLRWMYARKLRDLPRGTPRREAGLGYTGTEDECRSLIREVRDHFTDRYEMNAGLELSYRTIRAMISNRVQRYDPFRPNDWKRLQPR